MGRFAFRWYEAHDGPACLAAILVKGLETAFSLVEAACLYSMRPRVPKLHRSGINDDFMVRLDFLCRAAGAFSSMS